MRALVHIVIFKIIKKLFDEFEMAMCFQVVTG